MTAERMAFQSVCGQPLQAVQWRPQGEVTGIVQLVHGMAEHIARYDDAAQALKRAGFLVVGHTHLGHGESASVKGFFGEKNGAETLLKDVHALREQTQATHPDAPYFILGHSMGSFITRSYMQAHGQGLSGVILSGTGHYAPPVVDMGLFLSRLMILLGQGAKPSLMIQRVSSAGNLKRIKPAKTTFDWLSTDEAAVQKYIDDPDCGFPFTACGYRDLFTLLKWLTDFDQLKQIPAGLPVYLFSGADDPIGGYGTGVGLVAAQMRRAGLKDVQVRLYKNGRHEMFNEPNADEVCRDVVQWLYNHLA